MQLLALERYCIPHWSMLRIYGMRLRHGLSPARGGVSGAEEVELLLENGARLVQTASFVLRNGFHYAPTLLHGEPASQGQYAWCTAEGHGGKGCERCGFCRKAGWAEV